MTHKEWLEMQKLINKEPHERTEDTEDRLQELLKLHDEEQRISHGRLGQTSGGLMMYFK